jgi:hypothetical protein
MWQNELLAKLRREELSNPMVSLLVTETGTHVIGKSSF